MPTEAKAQPNIFAYEIPTSPDEESITLGHGANSVNLVKKTIGGVPVFVDKNFTETEIAPPHSHASAWWQFWRR